MANALPYQSIAKAFTICLSAFEEALDVLEGHRAVPLPKWRDEIGRLRIWAANIAAPQTGQSSLDFRLRDAPHIHQQILHLLNDLREAIHELREALIEPENTMIVDYVAESSDDPDNPSDEGSPESEIEQLHRTFVNIIDCLFQMSMLVRKPARHKYPTDSTLESSFGPYDRGHVADKFPAADTDIIDRLARANTRRRAHLKNRERRRLKFGMDLDEAQAGSILSETVASDFSLHEHAPSTSGSITSYASSLQSGTMLTIPPPPKASANQKPFECPYCFYVISIESSHSWTDHVFQDILPYICLFPDCSTPEKLYDNGHDWYDHVRSSHLARVEDQTCLLCGSSLASGIQLKRHLARHLQDLALFVLPATVEEDNEDVLSTIMEAVGTASEEGEVTSEENDETFAAPESERNRDHNEQDSAAMGSEDIEDNKERENTILQQTLTDSEHAATPNTSSVVSSLARLARSNPRKSSYFWYCGWCDKGPMTVPLHDFCLFCHHRKDGYAQYRRSVR
ncbi:MAG: hypothetical protein Q9170_005760 [Blastenia crenularia]